MMVGRTQTSIEEQGEYMGSGLNFYCPFAFYYGHQG